MNGTTERVNTDPDGLECYSDHAHDINTCGVCSFCDSNDPNVTGHILPDAQRPRGIDPVQASAWVMRTQSAKFVDGVLLDHFTASAIQAVHAALSTESARAKLRGMSLVKAADVCFRLINKQNAR